MQDEVRQELLELMLHRGRLSRDESGVQATALGAFSVWKEFEVFQVAPVTTAPTALHQHALTRVSVGRCRSKCVPSRVAMR